MPSHLQFHTYTHDSYILTYVYLQIANADKLCKNTQCLITCSGSYLCLHTHTYVYCTNHPQLKWYTCVTSVLFVQHGWSCSHTRVCILNNIHVYTHTQCSHIRVCFYIRMYVMCMQLATVAIHLTFSQLSYNSIITILPMWLLAQFFPYRAYVGCITQCGGRNAKLWTKQNLANLVTNTMYYLHEECTQPVPSLTHDRCPCDASCDLMVQPHLIYKLPGYLVYKLTITSQLATVLLHILLFNFTYSQCYKTSSSL